MPLLPRRARRAAQSRPQHHGPQRPHARRKRIPDGDYAFWETLFAAIKPAGRRIDLDLHAKGTDQRHINIALGTGMPVSMAPKFWAEHLGMPYHQAAIREDEMRQARPDEPRNAATMRRFLRYGYGDYLKDDRKYGIIHRVWPGTQRHLLWATPPWPPATAAHSASPAAWASSCSSRSPSRAAWQRPARRPQCVRRQIARPEVRLSKIRLPVSCLGPAGLQSETDADGWRRYMRRQFQGAAQPAETALSNASRILPVITPRMRVRIEQ